MVRLDLHWSKGILSFFRCEQLLVAQYEERSKMETNEWMREEEKNGSERNEMKRKEGGK